MKSTPLIAALTIACTAVITANPVHASEGRSSDQPAYGAYKIPYPQATQRDPLTTDRVNTASTRLVDARRGYRSYDSVCPYGCGSHGAEGHANPYQFESFDSFGIVRPNRAVRPYRRIQPRTGVTEFRSPLVTKESGAAKQDPAAYQRRGVTTHRNAHPRPTTIKIKRIKKENIGVADAGLDADTVTVYRVPDMPQASGAVLVGPDGTIYTIGS